MNIHFGNQSQFELFPKTTGDTIENVAPRFIFSRVVLTFENLVVTFVFILVSLIIAYSIGVERGRRNPAIARAIAQPISVADRTTTAMARQPVVAPVVPAIPKALPDMAKPAEAARIMPPAAPVLPAIAPKAPLEKGVDKGYTIQVASYKLESLAQKEAKALRGQGMDSLVLTKGSYSIVCVGQFAKPDEAKKLFNKLKKKYKDSIIRSF